jgi:hypothetical protein
MRCEDVRLLIGAWQDEELSGLTAWRIRRHVRRCPACSTEAAELAGLDKRLRAAAPFGPERNLRLPTFLCSIWRRRASGGALALVVAGLILFGAYRVKPPATGRETAVRGAAVVLSPPPAPRSEMPAKRETSAPTSDLVIRQVPDKPRRRGIAAITPEPGRKSRRRSGRFATRTRIAAATWPESRHPRSAFPVRPPHRSPVRRAEQQIILIASRTLTPEEVAAKNELLLIRAIPVPPEYRPNHIE